MSGEVIEIEYQLTVDDLAKFSADVQTSPTHMKALRKKFVNICIFLAVFIEFMCCLTYSNQVISGEIVDVGLLSYHYTYWFSSANIFILFILSFSYWFSYSKRRFYKHLFSYSKNLYGFGDNIAFFSKKKITLSSDKIVNISEFDKMDFLWSGLEKVQILNGDVVLFNSAASGLIIPSRFFKSEEEKQRVYAQCVAWFDAAREKAA